MAALYADLPSRRIGGLEIPEVWVPKSQIPSRRIGGLESQGAFRCLGAEPSRRIGGLENFTTAFRRRI